MTECSYFLDRSEVVEGSDRQIFRVSCWLIATCTLLTHVYGLLACVCHKDACYEINFLDITKTVKVNTSAHQRNVKNALMQIRVLKWHFVGHVIWGSVYSPSPFYWWQTDFLFLLVKYSGWLMQVPENHAARELADSIVEAWKLYGRSKLVH